MVMAKNIAAAESVKAVSTQNTVPKGLIPSCTTDSTVTDGIAIASKKDPKTSFFMEIFFITIYFIGLWVPHDSFPDLNVKQFMFSRFPFFHEESPACAFLSRNWKKARRQTSSFLFYQIFSGGSSQKQTKITTILPPRKIPVAMDFHRSSAWKAMILSINRYPIANKILWGILKCFGKSFMNRTRRPTIIIGPTISISQNKGSSMRTSNPRTTGIKADGIRKHAKKLNITLLKNFLFIVLLFLFIYRVNNIFFL